MKKTYDSKNCDGSSLDFQMREIFIRSMNFLFGDFKKYTSFIDDIPLFNYTCFVDHRERETKDFYLDFTQTQIFRNFLQYSANESFPYFDDMKYKAENRRNSSIERHYSANSASDTKSRDDGFSTNKMRKQPTMGNTFEKKATLSKFNKQPSYSNSDTSKVLEDMQKSMPLSENFNKLHLWENSFLFD